MNRYVWTEMQKKSDKEVKYIQEREYVSLSMEISSSNNENIYVSLAKRFPFLLYKRISEYITSSDFDVLMHYIADLDLKSGYEFSNISKNLIEKDIYNKKYGIKTKNIFNILDRKSKDSILDCIYKYEMGSIDSFIFAVKYIIEKCVVYSGSDMVIVYIEMEEKNKINDLIELLRILFLPVGIKLKIHYKYHMGIIGNSSFMRIGKIRIL